MIIRVGGGDCDRKTVKFPGVMVARRDVPRGVVRWEWASWRKWSVIADWHLEDAMADNEPPTGGLGKGRCVGLAWTDVEVGTSAGVEAMVVVDGRCDRRDRISSSDSWPSCAGSMAKSADVIVIVNNQSERDE
jgi:hypothetical protein